MRIIILLLGLFTSATVSQDVVQVLCSHAAMTVRIQKEIVLTAEYQMDDLHLNDKTCAFDREDGQFFAYQITPLTSCGTHVEANDTHVTFSNSISTVETGPTYPYGVVIGSQSNNRVLSALISCTYRIDLNVSTMFIPNISVVVIQMPDAYGLGEFRAAMALYTDGTYREPFTSPPIMDPDTTLYVGVMMVGRASSDIYLLMEECWGTITNDPNGSPKYPLIRDGCPVKSSADGLVRVSQNGNGHQALWNSPVFKFVGEGEAFDNVWLHCDLQICINSPCVPTCPTSRKKRALGDGSAYGPEQHNSHHIITVGPVTRLKITQIYMNETKTTYVNVGEVVAPVMESNGNSAPDSHPSFWNPAVTAVVGGLGGLALICIILALVVVILRSHGSSGNAGFHLSGISNKAFA